jgi:hypothetical protein
MTLLNYGCRIIMNLPNPPKKIRDEKEGFDLGA